jgi:hypothetical protein
MSNIITVQLPTETSYWGSTATDADVTRALDNLEAMIRREFSDAPFEIAFERTRTPTGSGIHGDDADTVEIIREFIETNWTAAL